MKERLIARLMERPGVVLIISLLVMVILGVLGPAFLATARTEDTVATNYRNHSAVFYVKATVPGAAAGTTRIIAAGRRSGTGPTVSSLTPTRRLGRPWDCDYAGPIV